MPKGIDLALSLGYDYIDTGRAQILGFLDKAQVLTREIAETVP